MKVPIFNNDKIGQLISPLIVGRRQKWDQTWISVDGYLTNVKCLNQDLNPLPSTAVCWTQWAIVWGDGNIGDCLITVQHINGRAIEILW